jgi:membrane protein insertase Oxa1/YidC/SpoIIIJ
MVKLCKIITCRRMQQTSCLNNLFLCNSFRHDRAPNIIYSLNKRNFFSTSTSLTNSNTNKIIDCSSIADTLPDNLPINDVNSIISFNQSILEFIHNSTVLPWWATILISTTLLRTFLTLPIAVVQQKNDAKILSLQPQIMGIFERLKHEVVREVKKRNGTYEEFQSELTKKVGCK